MVPSDNPTIPLQPRDRDDGLFAIESARRTPPSQACFPGLSCAKSTAVTRCGLVSARERTEQMMKQILDKAEVALEYPDKFYSGTFERSSRCEAPFDSVGVSLVLEHPNDTGTLISFHLQINYGVVADI